MFVDASEEVQREIAGLRADAEAAFTSILQWLLSTTDERHLVDVEQQLWHRLLALGRALVALWLVHRRPQRVPRVVRGADGRTYRWSGTRSSTVKPMFGEVSFRRDFYVIGNGNRGDTFVPFDRAVGLQPAVFSLACIGHAAYLAAKMAFSEVATTLHRFWGWSPATKSILKMVDQVGPLARPCLEAQAAPDGDGEILYIQPDAGGAPMINATEMQRRRRPHKKRAPGEPHWRRRKPRTRRKRRRKGDKSKNAKMATVGVIYTLRRLPDGRIEGPIHKRVFASFRCAEELFVWLHAEAVKRGYGTKRTIFLADGDRKLWRLQQRYFPLAETCIDWCHVVEKLWSLGTTVHREGSPELADWVHQQTKDLRAGRIEKIIHHLDHLAATRSTSAKRKRLADGIRYLANNAHRMPYAKLGADGLDIASGAVEGAVRQLVRMRLDGPGMRWSPARAEHVLHLRCIVINGQWDAFMRYVEHHARTVGLREERPPGLGRTHDAKLKCAA